MTDIPANTRRNTIQPDSTQVYDLLSRVREESGVSIISESLVGHIAAQRCINQGWIALDGWAWVDDHRTRQFCLTEAGRQEKRRLEATLDFGG